jgi:hypothetical protein
VNRKGPQPQPQQQQQQCIHSSSSRQQQQQRRRQCMECSIRREGAVVAAVFRPVVFYMLFFKFIAEPYKFLTTKKYMDTVVRIVRFTTNVT